MAEYPPDRFDNIADDVDRVGAHRAPRPRGRGFVMVAWAALASGALVVGGLYGLSLISDSVSFEIPGFVAEPEPEPEPTEEPEPEPTVEPITDPALAVLPEGFTITILNGAGIAGLGGSADDILTASGWPVGTVTAAGQDDLAETVIFYSTPDLEGVARGMAVLLGVGAVEISDAFPGAPITIALGRDFAEIAP